MKRTSLLITIIIIFSFNIISPQSNIKTVNKLAKKCIKGRAKSCEKLNIIAMTDARGDVRKAAAQALGKAGDPRAVEPLIKVLGDENIKVRASAAWALGKIGDPRAVEPLIKVLGDKDSNVRKNATWALGEIGDPRAVEPLIKALGDKDSDVRSYAAGALGKAGDPRAVEPLSKALGDKYSDVRKYASWALGEIGDSRAVEPLIKALSDKVSDVRMNAAKALGKIGDPRAVGPLLKALWYFNSEIGRSADGALGKIGAPAVEPLIKYLGDEDKYVRRNAAGALGSLGWKPTNRIEEIKYYLAKEEWDKLVAIGAPAVESLIKALEDEDKYVRENAARALDKIGAPAVEPLIKVLGDKYSGVRGNAAQALDRLGWKPTNRIEEIKYYLAKKEWDKLVEIGAPAVEPLINKALGDKDYYFRLNAAETLGKIGAPAVKPLIKAAMVDSLINPWIINVLLDMQVTDPEAVELYIRSLNLGSDDQRLKVANIILNSNDPKAVKARPQARQVLASIIYITEIVNYDNYGRAASSVLKNREGQEVAKKEIWFSPYNPTIKHAEVITDLKTGYQFQAVIYDDYGRPKNPMWLCLDKKGNIIRRSDKPVLVKPFDDQQKSEFKIVNNVRGFKDKKITKIYPCDNCAGQTGEKNCKYVW